MQDLPTAPQLLRAVADSLEKSVLPATSGGVAHHVRVAANLCRILEREAQLGAVAETEAAALLAELLERRSTAEPDPDPSIGSLALADALYDRIMAGPDQPAGATDALTAIVANKLRVAKPGYDAYDFATERRLFSEASRGEADDAEASRGEADDAEASRGEADDA